MMIINGILSLDRNSIKEASYNIGIQISQSSASLTKIVTFCPYFMVYNSADFNIEMKVRLELLMSKLELSYVPVFLHFKFLKQKTLNITARN